MRVELQEADGVIVLSLEGEMTFDTISEVKIALLDALGSKPEKLVLDMNRISDMDLCGLQCLYAFLSSASAAGTGIVVSTGAAQPIISKLLGSAGLPSIESVMEPAIG